MRPNSTSHGRNSRAAQLFGPHDSANVGYVTALPPASRVTMACEIRTSYVSEKIQYMRRLETTDSGAVLGRQRVVVRFPGFYSGYKKPHAANSPSIKAPNVLSNITSRNAHYS